MNAAFASDMLLHRPDSDIRYIEHMNRMSEIHEAEKEKEERRWQAVTEAAGTLMAAVGGESVLPQSKRVNSSDAVTNSGTATGAVEEKTASDVKDHPLFQAVLKGNKDSVVDVVKQALETGLKPDSIINDYLIAAINEVGDLFNAKKYFLPQLIGSANTMKLAIDYLEPLMEKREGGEELPTLVVATVEGDIHDIGKNLVVLMLKNYGYNVIDLGKDVPCEVIVDTAMKENAAIIGLSALMTTTMMRMQDVIELCKEKGCTSKVVIGGACITPSFAEEIGADGYSKDAAECVKLVEQLLKSN